MKFSSIILAITALLASTVIAAPWGVYNNVHADHDVVRDPSTGNIHYANPHTGEISAPIAHESQLNQGFNGGFQHHQGARSASWGSFWGSVGNALNPK